MFHENSRDQYRRRRRAVQRHGCVSIGLPMSNLAAAASNFAPNESVRYVHKHYRYRDSSRGYSGYAADCRYGYGPSSRCYP